ncbi:MAG TPA: trimethylamine methyltransferase family protein, partial [Candidatus Krumholzibacterium sp.]|nr:trimethylamine methyltransferase family protein [Candidatus Krumholzibacterium sp.]
DGAGATIDGDRTKIPASVVEKALETAPDTIKVYDRHGQLRMDLGGDRVHFNPGSAALRIFDPEIGDARTPVTADVVKYATIIDSLPNYAAQSTGLVPGDVPEDIADRYRVFLGLQYSSKPIVTGTFQVEAFKVMHAMLSAVAGGDEKLREKPNAIFDCCPSPPLAWSDLTCQALIDCSRTGLPAELVSMPLTGATSPVTLAGAVVQHCAENLSGITIHQLANPGSPIIYGGSPACFDMRKGTTPMGAVETMMIDGAYAEIGKYLGVPTHAYMALSDSKPVDYQAGMETAMGAILAAVSGVNNVSGPGMLDFESCQSLEKLVLDHEVVSMALRLTGGIELRDDPIAAPLIQSGIKRKEFLSLPHTMKWFRKEAYFPHEVIERGTLEEWREKGKKDAAQRANDRVKEILASHTPEPLDPKIVEHITGLMTEEAKKAGMDALPAR